MEDHAVGDSTELTQFIQGPGHIRIGRCPCIAAASGIPLTDTVPPHADLEKLRDMMRGSGQGNVAEALSTLSRYRVRKSHE